MLNKKLKELTLGEAIFAIFMSACVAFAFFCFMMAFATAMSGPAHAEEAEYTLVPMPDAPKEKAELNSNICNHVGIVAGLMKNKIDQGWTDDAIIELITRAAQANTKDHDGWVAANMLLADDVLPKLRMLPNSHAYKQLQQKLPQLDAAGLTNAYVGGMCMDAMDRGETQDIIPLKKVYVKP